MIPPSFAMTPAQDQKLSLRCHEAVSAVLAHEANEQAVRGCQSELLVALVLHKIATREPKQHLVPPEQLQVLLPDLETAARAVSEVARRFKETGKVGCTAEQRQGILRLPEIMDAMRAALPRRLWLRAYREAYRR